MGLWDRVCVQSSLMDLCPGKRVSLSPSPADSCSNPLEPCLRIANSFGRQLPIRIT